MVYSYAPGRSGDYAAALLRGYTGILQTDGYAGWTCFGKVESSPVSNEELDDAAAPVYERI